MNRDLLFLLQGQFISQIGTQLAQIATIFWLTTATGSPAVVGAFMAACALPPLLLAPLGGICVDIFPKKAVIVLCDSLAALAVLAVVWFSESFDARSKLFVVALFGVNILLAGLNAFFLPAVGALVPSLAKQDKLHLAISWFQTISMASLVTGQAAAGLLLGWQTPQFLYFVDSLSYAFAAILESRIRVSGAVFAPTERMNFFAASTEGLRYVWKRSDLRRLFFGAVPLNVLISPLWVMLPFYTTAVVGKAENWYGFFLASFCLGLLAGYLLPMLAKIVMRESPSTMILSVLAVPLMMLGLAIFRSAPFTIVALAVIGLSTGLISIIGVVVIQKRTDDDAQGRVMGLLIMTTQGLAPLIGSIAGFVTGKTASDIRILYALCGLLTLVSTATFLARASARQLFRVPDGAVNAE